MLKQSNKVESNQPNKIEFKCFWNNNTNTKNIWKHIVLFIVNLKTH